VKELGAIEVLEHLNILTWSPHSKGFEAERGRCAYLEVMLAVSYLERSCN
jgi:hypothetical protein